MKTKTAKKQLKELIGCLRDKNLSSSANSGLENMLYYFDTIWNDQWYDYGFMLKLWYKKLKDMENNWMRSIYVGKEKDYKDIKKARKLLKLLIKDEFNEKHDKIIDKEYGKIQKKSKKNKDKSVQIQFFREKEMDEEYESKVELGRKNTKKDKKKVQNKFFKLLQKYENWWD